MTRSLGFVLAALVLVAGHAEAQSTAEQARVFVTVNGGYQSGQQSFSGTQTPEFYGEDGRVESDYRIRRAGALFDARVSAKVWRRLEVGGGFSLASSNQSATVNASIPHPLFYAQPRTASTTASGLEHSEKALHVQVIWRVPVSERIDVAVSAGPSVFFVTQDIITSVQIGEVGPPYDQVQIGSVVTTSRQRRAVGANAGVDVGIMFWRQVGGGVFVRYAGASARMDLGSDSVSIKAGGFQAGGGLRLRF